MKKLLSLGMLFALPLLSFAQTQGGDASAFFDKVKTNVVNPIIELLALAAFVVFVWGVIDFIWNADDAEKRATGQQHMIWGIVGLVIIFGTNAIINILKSTFGI
jgi:hypothetical protein